MDSSELEALKRAYDEGAGLSMVDDHALPAAAKHQLAVEERERREAGQAHDDQYAPRAAQLMAAGKKFFVIGRDTTDVGDFHFTIFDAAGARVASGGGTERDGAYWDD
jgi:hypothetical protein